MNGLGEIFSDTFIQFFFFVVSPVFGVLRFGIRARSSASVTSRAIT